MQKKSLIGTGLLCLLGLLVGGVAMAAPDFEVQPLAGVLGEEREAIAKPGPLKGAIRTDDGRVSVIVQLAEHPLALYEGSIEGLAATTPTKNGRRKLDMKAAATGAYVDFLKTRQLRFVDELTAVAPSATVTHSYQVVFNGVAMAVDESEIDTIRRMPGVKKVFPDRMMYATMDASLPLINAPDFWAQLGGQANAGSGIIIGTIDGGIRPENPMFDDVGFTAPAGYPPASSYCGTTDPAFCNNKLISARYYPPASLFPGEYLSPLGFNGHGTHTAGISGGNGNVAADAGDGVVEIISGVAPAAYVMAYKALWWNGTTGSGSTAGLIAAINDAVADGADVLNNSYGGAGGEDPATDAFGPTVDAAVAAGVVFVASAGNVGPGADTIACPACHENALTVGNSTHDRIHAFGFDVTGGPSGLAALEGTGPSLGATLGPAPIVYAGDLDPLNFEGCNPFPAGSMSGALALISRGSCSFAIKVTNAEAAGAIGAVVFNNLGGAPIIMGGLNVGETISSVMLSNAQGVAVRDHVQANPGALGTISLPISRYTDSEWADIVATSSSRGPNGNPDVLKPDIIAPGTLILSAHSPDLPPNVGGAFAFLSGTSMSGPHVAGAVALVLQQHPSWTPDQVKTALTSTSVRGLRKEDGATNADPFDIGAGRLDLGRARKAAVTFDKASMADSACFQNCAFTRAIKNERGFPSIWVATVDKLTPELDVRIKPSVVLVGSGQSKSFDVEVDTTLVTPNQWHFAYVVWKDLAGLAPDAVQPIAVFSAGSTDGNLVNKTVDKATAGPKETLTYTIDITNLTLTDPISLVDPVPDNATFVPGSELALVNGVPDPSFTYDAGNDELTWTGTLAPANLGLTASPSPFGYVPLSAFFGPLGCSAVCDDTSTTLSGVNFDYLGQTYTSVVMSSNGFIVAGGDTTDAFTPANQSLPDAATPNNVIAPFWTDLDMDGTDPADSGAGIWYAGLLSAGPDTFLVMEWAGVELFGVPGFPFTFQIWIQQGTDNIWFVYAGIPGLPSALTVGVEDSQGLLGSNYYNDGTGTAPAVGTDLQVLASAGESATFTFQVETGCVSDPVVNVVDVTSTSTAASAFAATDVVPSATPVLCIEGSCPGRLTFTGSGFTPLSLATTWRGNTPGSDNVPFGFCSGTALGLDNPKFLRTSITNLHGEFGFSRNIPSSQCAQAAQTVDVSTCATSQVEPFN